MLTRAALRGTETRTPAGTGSTCGEPTGSATVRNTSVGAIAAVRYSNAPGPAGITYSREDGGAFYYRDARATGQLNLIEGGGYYSLPSSASAGSWFWTGFWTDATGVEIVSGG